MNFFSKASLFPVLTLVGFSSANAATSVGYNFDSETSGDLFTGDVIGWTQDTPNPSAFGQTFPLAYVDSVDFGGGSSLAGQIGTQFANTSDNSSTTVSGDLDVTSLDSTSPSLTLNLAILDNSADSFPGRDIFSVALNDGLGQEIATIGFTPTVGIPEVWDISVGTNGASTTTLGQVDALAGYIFIVNFDSAGTTFLYGPSQGTTSPVLLSTQAPVSGFGSRIASIDMTHEPVSPAGTSANTLVFDNIVVTIPEPGSSMLLLIAAGMVSLRRRSQ